MLVNLQGGVRRIFSLSEKPPRGGSFAGAPSDRFIFPIIGRGCSRDLLEGILEMALRREGKVTRNGGQALVRVQEQSLGFGDLLFLDVLVVIIPAGDNTLEAHFDFKFSIDQNSSTIQGETEIEAPVLAGKDSWYYKDPLEESRTDVPRDGR